MELHGEGQVYYLGFLKVYDAALFTEKLASEEEILIARVAVGGTQKAELGQGVAETVRRSFDQVVPLAPGEGSVVDLELDVIL